MKTLIALTGALIPIGPLELNLYFITFHFFTNATVQLWNWTLFVIVPPIGWLPVCNTNTVVIYVIYIQPFVLCLWIVKWERCSSFCTPCACVHIKPTSSVIVINQVKLHTCINFVPTEIHRVNYSTPILKSRSIYIYLYLYINL